MHFADIKVTHFTGGAYFGLQAISILRSGALQGHATVQLLVDRFVDQAHTAGTPTNLAYDMEPARHQAAWTEGVDGLGRELSLVAPSSAGVGNHRRPAGHAIPFKPRLNLTTQ